MSSSRKSKRKAKPTPSQVQLWTKAPFTNLVRYHNPATAIKRVSVRPKRLTLPGFNQFTQFVQAMESAGGRDSRNCVELVHFLAFGGFRLGEAANIAWTDCNFTKGEITVRGEAETGLVSGATNVNSIPTSPRLFRISPPSFGMDPSAQNPL